MLGYSAHYFHTTVFDTHHIIIVIIFSLRITKFLQPSLPLLECVVEEVLKSRNLLT